MTTKVDEQPARKQQKKDNRDPLNERGIHSKSIVELDERANGAVLLVRIHGKLTKSDYQSFVPEVERAIASNGKVRMLVELADFEGWTMGALWEDIKFDAKHFAHIERLALVGDSAWEHGMAVFCRPFTTAKIRYFDAKDLSQAKAWTFEGLNHA